MSTLLKVQAEQQTHITHIFDPKALEALILQDLSLSPLEAKIDFLVEEVRSGYGSGEHKVAAFKGVRVTVRK